MTYGSLEFPHLLIRRLLPLVGRLGRPEYFLAYGAWNLGLGYYEFESAPVRAQAHKVRALFAAVDLASAVVMAGTLVKCLDARFQLLTHVDQFYQLRSLALIIPLNLAGFVWIGSFVGMSVAAQHVGNRMLFDRYPSASPSQHLQYEARVTWDRPASHRCSQVALACQLFLSAMLACLSDQPLVHAASAGAIGFGLVQLSRQPWLKVSVTVPLGPDTHPNATGMAVSTMASLLPAKAGGECSICLETEAPASTAFCPSAHAFHASCIAGQLYSCMTLTAGHGRMVGTQFHEINRLLHEGRMRRTVQSSRDGQQIQYRVTIPEANLPTCPNCRGAPVASTLQLEIIEGGTRRPTSLTISGGNSGCWNRLRYFLWNKLHG
jgi:hypothetical protein